MSPTHLDRMSAEEARGWDLWELHGSLYDAGEDERVEGELLAAFESEIAPVDRRAAPGEVVDGEAEWSDRQTGNGGGVAVRGAPDEATLVEIGNALGVSRERARCIILEAQRTFAKNWRGMFPDLPNPLL